MDPWGRRMEGQKWDAGVGMATGNSPSGNGLPSPSPRGGKFPAPVPANARGERFLPIPVPERGIFPAGSLFPEHANAKSTGS
jgi:hypothetical protein